MTKRIRFLMYWVACEITGKVGQYGYAVGNFGVRAEFWAAKRRDRP